MLRIAFPENLAAGFAVVCEKYSKQIEWPNRGLQLTSDADVIKDVRDHSLTSIDEGG